MSEVSTIHSEIAVCAVSDILPDSGVCAAIGDLQIAIFRVDDQLFALDNYDPFSEANVLSRGLICSIEGRLTIASPIYKQHFDLQNGECLEDQTVRLNCYPVRSEAGQVFLSATPTLSAAA